jgi:hypothetical protein
MVPVVIRGPEAGEQRAERAVEMEAVPAPATDDPGDRLDRIHGGRPFQVDRIGGILHEYHPTA